MSSVKQMVICFWGVIIWTIINCLCFNSFVSAAIDVEGYYKSYFSALDPAPYQYEGTTTSGPVEGIVQNRLRLKIFWPFSDSFSFNLAYDLKPTVQPTQSDLSMTDFFPVPDPLSYRIDDLHQTLYPATDEPEGSFYIAQNLDRLCLTVSFPVMDLYIGRQAIAFGSAHVINPTDILAPFTYDALDTEERTGVDAIRIKIPIGAMNEIDVGTVFGEDFKNQKSAAFLRTKFSVFQTDLSLISLAFKDNLLLGFDMARSVGGAGFWFEMAYTYDSIFAEEEPESTKCYNRISTGFDYNLTENIYGFIEYHYNGAGMEQPEDFVEAWRYTAYTEGGVYLLGQHYLAPGLTYQITPLLICNTNAIINLTDPSTFVSSMFEYNPAQDIYIELGAYISVGQKMDVVASYNSTGESFFIIPQSEFGLYSDFYFSSIRIYF